MRAHLHDVRHGKYSDRDLAKIDRFRKMHVLQKRDFLRLMARIREPRIVASAGALALITTQANNGQMLPSAYKT